jgi:hypothetical protein
MGLLNPYISFLAVLFILLIIPAALGISESFRSMVTEFTFVPRWQTKECNQGMWNGPTGYPLEVSGPQWDYVGYVEEQFSPNMEIYSQPDAANLIDDGTEFQKDASQLTMSADHPKMDVKAPRDNKDDIAAFPLNGPAPDPSEPNYELLADVLEATPNSGISNTNARSCYATNFERQLEKTGNFRQFTNNYKHGYPDSCSSPFSELVLPFYKSTGLNVPAKGQCFKMGRPTYR